MAREEIFSLFEIKDHLLLDKSKILKAGIKSGKTTERLFQRLALTKKIYRLLFKCKVRYLAEKINAFRWGSVYKENFCVRVRHFGKKFAMNEKEIARLIWAKLENPSVDLRNPKTLIEFFSVRNSVYCGILIMQNHGNFESRKAHLRPFLHPSSLHPKLARALVNLTGIGKENGKANAKKPVLCDPFCGTGGFLIEAELMGIRAVGYDISGKMIEGAMSNLEFFGFKDCQISNNDATKLDKKMDYVVTDLPYGLNSNVISDYEISRKNSNNAVYDIEKFYLKFLRGIRRLLRHDAVVVFPNFVKHKKLLRKSGFNVEKEFSIYVHGSLSRIVVKIS